jgi:Rrf2 family transcriptional regulator, iron-sulfur cluster assembly transcription factor
MIRLSKRLLYSIEAVLDIACHEGPAPVRSVDISQREGIPARYLEPVLQELVHENILIGIRGPAGGYRLGRPAEEISVGDIVHIVQRTESGEDPMADPAESVLGLEVVRPLWTELRDEVMRRLQTTSLAQLRRKGLRALRAVSNQPQPTTPNTRGWKAH